MIDKSVKNESGEARTHAMKIRLTPAEDATIQRKATEAGLSGAEYVRRAALGAKFAAPRRVRIGGMPELIRVSGLMGYCLRMLEEAGRQLQTSARALAVGEVAVREFVLAMLRVGMLVMRAVSSLALLYRQSIPLISRLQVDAEEMHRRLNGEAEDAGGEDEGGRACRS